MNINELNNYLQSLGDDIIADAAEIVAETATRYFQEAFTKKAFDGNPWAAPLKARRNGSLLVDTGQLVNSIRPALVTPQRVVISAGNSKVDYAQVHNEGHSGPMAVPAHTRRQRGKMVNVRAHTRKSNIPARPFMGDSQELNDRIHDQIEGYIESLNE